ncbi:MAG: hypothetical protein M3Q52_03935 [Pseudomonadota bacterium]|nr:hypothetical protein [Pseudomonadota bacterium]
MRIAFLVPAPNFPEPWRWAFDAEASALVAAGVTVDPIAWTEAGDLLGYDLVLPLVTWGYHLRYAEWLAFLDRLERERIPVVNPPALLRWNSDKSYLFELARKGIPAVPTMAVERCDETHLDEARTHFASDWLVIKPPVSAGATGTFRIGPDDPIPDESRGRAAIIQPLIRSIATAGEYSLILFDGEFSHAVVKRPAPGDFRVQPHFGGVTEPCAAPSGSVELAQAALAAAPAQATYARVDIIPDDEGVLKIMELELVEPALFLDHAPDGGAAFAASILRAAGAAKQPLAQR